MGYGFRHPILIRHEINTLAVPPTATQVVAIWMYNPGHMAFAPGSRPRQYSNVKHRHKLGGRQCAQITNRALNRWNKSWHSLSRKTSGPSAPVLQMVVGLRWHKHPTNKQVGFRLLEQSPPGGSIICLDPVG